VILTRVVIDDFNIFQGRQELDLSKGLYVIHGQNGHGKSTFLNAIAWALFGEYLDRQGDPVTPRVMLNRDAAAAGTTSFGVELLLTDGADQIRVRRSFDTSAPHNGVQLVVEKNGNALNQDAGEALLRGLLNRDVSRFFLFDGEELRRYEELLFGQADSAAEVRSSIEHILGLPALTNAVVDLKAVADRFASDANKEAQKEKAAQKSALLAGQLEDDLKHAEDDLVKLQEQLAGFLKERDGATALLQEDGASQELIAKRVEIETKISQIEMNRDALVSDRKRSLGGVWRDVLSAVVKPKRDELEAHLNEERRREQWRAEADELEAALAAGVCDRCNQPLHDDSETTMKARLTQLRAKPRSVGVSADAANTLARLAGIAPNDHAKLAMEQDLRISQTGTQVTALQQQLSDLSVQIEGVPVVELREASQKREKASEMIGVTNLRIDDQKNRIEKTRDGLAAARADAQAHATSQKAAALTARKNRALEIASIFEKAIDRFRDVMREKVGKDASDLFVKLIHEPDLTGLQINEHYGLVVIGDDNQPTPGRSAGQEQIVAFSLIGALSKNATRQAPIVMDTPLGRLDEDHKVNVMINLPDFGEQVLLLVHDGEVSDDLLNPIRSRVVAEYELRQLSLFSTEIRKREA
jgi:DNA sulfur modification protein DndD